MTRSCIFAMLVTHLLTLSESLVLSFSELSNSLSRHSRFLSIVMAANYLYLVQLYTHSGQAGLFLKVEAVKKSYLKLSHF